MRVNWTRLLLLSVLCPALFSREMRFPVTIRLVKAENIEETVDRGNEQTPVTETVGGEEVLLGTRVVCWAKNIKVDQKYGFERYYKGRYIDRLPTLRLELSPGEHIIFPGNHRFTVDESGAISTKDPELLVRGKKLLVKCYPVTLMGYEANRLTAYPISMRTFPLSKCAIFASLRKLAPKTDEEVEEELDLLPVYKNFYPLTVYLPANVGKGYRFVPGGYRFRVSGKGLQVLRPDGTPVEKGVVDVEGYRIAIPAYACELVGRTRYWVGAMGAVGAQTLSVRNHGQIVLPSSVTKTEKKIIRLFNSPVAYPFYAGMEKPDTHLCIRGDFHRFPYRKFVFDNTDFRTEEARRFTIALSRKELKVGESLLLRLQFLDASVQTIEEPRFVGFYRTYSPSAEEETVWEPLEPKLVDNVNSFYEVDTPQVSSGFYELKFSVGGDDALSATFVVSIINPDDPGTISVSTQNGRDAFFEGERFRFCVVARPTRRLNGELRLWLSSGSGRIPLFSKRVSLREATTWIFDAERKFTSLLIPGKYTLEAELLPLRAFNQAIEIVGLEKRTNFMIDFLTKYNQIGRLFYSLGTIGRRRKNGLDIPFLVREVAELGFNAVADLQYKHGIKRVPDDLEIEDMARLDARLPSPEKLYTPSGAEIHINEMVRHNIDYWHEVITNNDLDLPHSYEPDLRSCRRQASLEAMRYRRAPCTKGLNTWDEIYWGSTVHGPHLDLKNQLIAERYEKLHGIRPEDVERRLSYQFVQRAPGQRNTSLYNLYVKWVRLKSDQFGILASLLDEVINWVIPDARNSMSYLSRSFLGNELLKGYRPTDFKDLEICRSHFYTDRSSNVPFQSEYAADFMKLPGKKVSIQVPSANNRELCQFGRTQLFNVVSQKVDGFGLWAFPYRWGIERSALKVAYQSMYREILERYGDLVLNLKQGYRKIAILNSFHCMAMDLYNKIASSSRAKEFWIACLRAGFPADVIYEEDLLRGNLKDYKIIIVPGVEYEEQLPHQILQKLRTYQEAGKIIMVEQSSRLPLKNIVRLEYEFDRTHAPTVAVFATYDDFEYDWYFDRTERATHYMKETLPKYIEPVARTDSTYIWFNLLSYGDSDYLFVCNNEYPPIPGGGVQQSYTAPVLREVSVPYRRGVCYDVLEMKEVQMERSGRWLKFTADLRYSEGKIYAFLPKAIGSVSLEVPEVATAGTTVPFTFSVLDEDGELINGAFPVEISLRTLDGEERLLIYRCARQAYRGTFKVGLNETSKKLRLSVRELVSGTRVEASVSVQPQPLDILSKSLKPNNDTVIVLDGKDVAELLSTAKEFYIPLDKEQGWLRPLAEELARRLRERGIKATVCNLPDVLYRFDPNGDDEYHGMRLETILPQIAVEQNLIILGGRRENRLIESALNQDLLPERLSEYYPGKGRALIEFAWLPFSTRHHSIFILAKDEEGIRAGIDRVLSLAPEDRTHWLPRPALSLEKTTTRARKLTSREPLMDPYSERVKLHNPILSLSYNPSSERIFVGTRGYGFNIFSIGADGAVLWKKHLPYRDVYRVQPTSDGRYLLCSTIFNNQTYLLDSSGKILFSFGTSPIRRLAGLGKEYLLRRRWQVSLHPEKAWITFVADLSIYSIEVTGNQRWTVDCFDKLGVIELGSGARNVKTARGHARAIDRALDKFVTSAFSPDGQYLALLEKKREEMRGQGEYIWFLTYTTLRLLDVATGKVLWELDDFPPYSAHTRRSLLFTPDSKNIIWYTFGGEIHIIDLNRNRLSRIAFPYNISELIPLEDDLIAYTSGRRLFRLNRSGKILWRAGDAGQLYCLAYAPANRALLVCDTDGEVFSFDISTGRVSRGPTLGGPAHILPFPDGGFLAGSVRGDLYRFDSAGKLLWQVDLAKDSLPESIEKMMSTPPPADITDRLYKQDADREGDLDGVVKFGINLLLNGGAESSGGWKGRLTFSTDAHSGKRSILLDGFIEQTCSENISTTATYLLEFWYKSLDEGVLTAGFMARGSEEPVYSVQFEGRRGEWRFGRIAGKTFMDTKEIAVGFESSRGKFLLDDIRLRKVRFPSANFLFYPELHRISPIWSEDVFTGYRGVPSVIKDKLKNYVFVPEGYSVNGKFIEPAFLHNGRLDDVKNHWFLLPCGSRLDIYINFEKPTSVSHLVLYFNHLYPRNVLRSYIVYGYDAEKGKEVVLKRVRGNRKLFAVYKFEPITVNYLRILELGDPDEDRNLTEIEVYGSLAGAGLPEGWPIEKAFPTLMGNAARSFGSPAPGPKLPLNHLRQKGWLPTPEGYTYSILSTPIAVAYGKLYFGMGAGSFLCYDYEKLQPVWTFNCRGAPPLSFPTVYSGRVFFGCSDGSVYSVRADNGHQIWQFKTSDRVYSSPLPVGEVVYFGSYDHYIYALDIDTGELMWKFKTAGRVHSSPAYAQKKVLCASFDGFLYAVDSVRGRLLWKARIGAPAFTTPSIDQGIVTIASDDGYLYAFDLSTGKLRWRFSLGDTISVSPINHGGIVYAGADNGLFVALDASTGAIRWRFQGDGAIRTEPALYQKQIIIAHGTRLTALDPKTGKVLSEALELPRPFATQAHLRESWWIHSLTPLPDSLIPSLRPMWNRHIEVAVYGDRGAIFIFTHKEEKKK